MSETKEKSQKTRVQDNSANDEIDLARLFGLLLDSKWLIVSVTALFMFIGVFYALMATPIYKADALIQIEEKSAGMPGLDSLGEMFATESEAVTEIELMKSRYVIGQAVDEVKLDVVATPKYFGSLGKFFARRYTRISKVSFNQPWLASFTSDSYAWGGEVINVASLTVPKGLEEKALTITYLGNNKFNLLLNEQHILTGTVNNIAQSATGDIKILITDLSANTGTEFLVTKRNRIEAIKDLQKSLSISEKGKQSGILYLAIEGPDKALAEKTLNAVNAAYLLQNVQRMSAEVQNSIDFLDQELPSIKDKLETAESLLNNYRLENESVDLSLETQSILEQIVVLDTRLHELSFKEAEIAQRFTKEHPSYVSLNKKKEELIAQKKQLSTSVKGLPETQQQILRLTRDVEVNQQIYLSLLNNVQQLKVAKAGTVGNVRIIDEAQVARLAVKPKKSLIVVLATLLGGMFSVAFVLIKAAFHRGVTNPQDFEDIGLTVYATIPVSDTQSKFLDKRKLKEKLSHKVGRKKLKVPEILVAKENPTDLAVEAIRSLRTSLHFAMLEAKNNIVMISGASPTVGKSFVSANLATVLAQAGQNILIIDADMRKGYVQKLFEQNAENGLSEYLIGDNDLSSSIKQTKIENLSVITRGKIPPNPSELLMGQRFTELLEQVKNQYDLIIIDTPPVLAVTDASIIGHQVGTSLMLARFNQSSLKEIAAAAHRFELNGVDIKGIIFNAVEKKASSYYGDYGYYNYEYK
ncbi:polysaccharide biosynthesis tyrosine autokinase [Thalassotalea sp. ND16A]|uniref:polysaccharide biosynthesis tyrosine autokinase n=1 Tax=Thalassotalea sp. ND16A TaxID=1535422 RepID=UPI00051A6009|nr:polysaccharide biosynthesis tyrosine autokinase [Thalassotalea sp. ND16A]KGJ94221.1 Non-specific protein-tyrosine kinase [Thalassotalea sp. ND16A]